MAVFYVFRAVRFHCHERTRQLGASGIRVRDWAVSEAKTLRSMRDRNRHLQRKLRGYTWKRKVCTRRIGRLRRWRSWFEVTALFPRRDTANFKEERYWTVRQCQRTTKHPLAFRRSGMAGERYEFSCFGIE
jgi:hypothetical protein